MTAAVDPADSNENIIKKIVNYPGLWKVKCNSRPKHNAPPFIPDAYPIFPLDDYLIDTDDPIEAYF
jgi:hypothetical protein